MSFILVVLLVLVIFNMGITRFCTGVKNGAKSVFGKKEDKQ